MKQEKKQTKLKI